MKRNIFFYCLTLVLFSVSFSSYAQEEDVETVVEPKKVTIQGLFDEMTDDSYNYNGYEMIKEPVLADFWATVTDSIQELKSKINTLSATIEKQEKTIVELRSELAETKETIATLETQISTINFMGMEMEKSSMNAVYWITTIILLVIIGVIVFLFYNANRVTRSKISDYEYIQNEFEEYKRTMKEREIQMKREFQTVQNKLWELEKK